MHNRDELKAEKIRIQHLDLTLFSQMEPHFHLEDPRSCLRDFILLCLSKHVYFLRTPVGFSRSSFFPFQCEIHYHGKWAGTRNGSMWESSMDLILQTQKPILNLQQRVKKPLHTHILFNTYLFSQKISESRMSSQVI